MSQEKLLDGDFIVESILEKQKKGHLTQYKIKWKGYPESDCTWESLRNMMNIKDMVMDFNENIKQKIQQTIDPNKQVLCHVEWKKRPDGVQPQDSIENAKDIRIYNKEALLDIYENNVQLIHGDQIKK